MHKLTNKDAWLQLFATNDNALIAAITLCQRFGPTDPTLTVPRQPTPQQQPTVMLC